MNGMAMNGMAMNGMAMNGMAMNGMAMNGMAMNGAFGAWFNNTSYTGQDNLMKYVIRCAVAAGSTVTYKDALGVTHTWTGTFGLAPSWVSGPMTAAEQRWVSACMLAHVNQFAVPIQVSFRAAPSTVTNPAPASLGTTPSEVAAYAYREASFWGNLFTPLPTKAACDARMLPTPNTPSYIDLQILMVGRGCGVADNCGISNMGACNQICQSTGGSSGGFGPCGTTKEVVTTFRNTSPVCGDGVCNATIGETKLTCSHDCK
jgi:hypothetical protein